MTAVMTNVKKMTTMESMTIESKVLNYDADVDADADAGGAGAVVDAGADAVDDRDDAVDCNNNDDGCANACDR